MHFQSIVVQHKKERFSFLIDENTSASMLIESVGLNGLTSCEDKYGLFTLAGELLKPNDLIWTIVKDFMVGDYFLYRMISQRVQVKSNLCPDGLAKIDLCFDQPLLNIIPIISRRFGVNDCDIAHVFIENEDLGTIINFNLAIIEIDSTKTFKESRIYEDDVVYIKVADELLIQSKARNSDQSRDTIDSEAIQYVNDPSLQNTFPNGSKIASASLCKLIERLTGEGDETCELRPLNQ